MNQSVKNVKAISGAISKAGSFLFSSAILAAPSSLDGRATVSPPTYAAPKGAKDQSSRNVEWITDQGSFVLLDSIQSSANRIEDQISAVRAAVGLPEIAVTVHSLKDSSRYTTLKLPHREYDAWLRESSRDGKKFPDTELGREIYGVDSSVDVGPLFLRCPTLLLLGGWNSHGKRKTQLKRVLRSDIVAKSVGSVRFTGGRMDPVAPGLLSDSEEGEDDQEKGKRLKVAYPGFFDKKDPSEMGLGMIPPTAPLGEEAGKFNLKKVVTEIESTAYVGLSELRRMKFGSWTPEQALAAKVVIACLGIYGIVAMRNEMDLRSGCDLSVLRVGDFSIKHGGKDEVEILPISGADTFEQKEFALEMLMSAISDLKSKGIAWNPSPEEFVLDLREHTKAGKKPSASKEVST
jgi:CRISPR-associated protein Csb1